MKNLKRVIALILVILWGILLLATLITAFIDTETSRSLFNGLIFTDITLPVVAYAILLIYRLLKNKNS